MQSGSGKWPTGPGLRVWPGPGRRQTDVDRRPGIACLMVRESGSECVMSDPKKVGAFPMLADPEPAQRRSAPKPSFVSLRAFMSGAPAPALADLSTPAFCTLILCVTTLAALLSNQVV